MMEDVNHHKELTKATRYGLSSGAMLFRPTSLPLCLQLQHAHIILPRGTTIRH